MVANHKSVIGKPLAHESAHLHVCGEAQYVDDLAEPAGTLFAAIGYSQQPHATLTKLNLSPVRNSPGVITVIDGHDIPGENNIGPIVHDEPIFATNTVEFSGQALFAVAAISVQQARQATRLAKIQYQPLPPVLNAADAQAANSFVLPSEKLTRGNPQQVLTSATHRLAGRFNIGGQEHFYLEGQAAFALPQESGGVLVFSSSQHLSEVQQLVAKALALRAHQVTVECRRMGGAFGGKESQAAQWACIAALLALRTQRPVKLRLDRDDDIRMTGKRHDFTVDYEVGFDDAGRIDAASLQLASRCGISADLSGPINDRALFHVDNCYFLKNLALVSHRCKTNTVSNTAFRGFGGPQGMLVIENIIDQIAHHLGKDPLDVRQLNFYGETERNETHYGTLITDNIAPKLVAQLERSADYRRRREDALVFNQQSPILKRGISLTPVKFGIAFTATHLNQAAALVNIYTDGSIGLSHGGTEMGQGLFTKVAQIVAAEFGLPLSSVRCMATDTAKIPNASATAASSGTDLNGMAALRAARSIKGKLTHYASSIYNVAPDKIQFSHGNVLIGEQQLEFAKLVHAAWMARIPLSATGFYRTPKIHYDRTHFNGRPFLYFCYGAAVSEVMVDTLTGESQVVRVDILQDVGKSINPAIDRGQIEGGFVQGMGWLTMEELVWNAQGELLTHAPSTYKIPTASDVPAQFNIDFWGLENSEKTVHRSKAVGEPPLMLAMSVFFAIKDAICSLTNYTHSPQLDAPATPERILNAVGACREHIQDVPQSDTLLPS